MAFPWPTSGVGDAPVTPVETLGQGFDATGQAVQAMVNPGSEQFNTFVQMSMLPRPQRLQALYLMNRAKKDAANEQANLQILQDEKRKADAELAQTQGGLDALIQRLSTPAPLPAQPTGTWGDAAAMAAGLLGGASGGQASDAVYSNQMDRAARQTAGQMAGYQAQMQGDSMRAGLMQDTMNRQQQYSDKLSGVLLDAQMGLPGNAQVRQDQIQGFMGSAISAEQQRQFEAQQSDLKYRRELQMKDYESQLKILEQQANSEYGQLVNAGYAPEQASRMIGQKYQSQYVDIQSKIQQMGIAANQENRAQQMFPTQLAQGQANLANTNASTMKIQQETALLPAKYQLDAYKVMSDLQMKAAQFDLDKTKASGDALMGSLKSASEKYDAMLKDAQKQLQAMDPDAPEYEQQQAYVGILTNKRKQALDNMSQLGRELSTGIKGIQPGSTKITDIPIPAPLNNALSAAGFSKGDVCKGQTDCSMFVGRVLSHLGVQNASPNDTTATLRKKGVQIDYKQIQPGDVIIFDTGAKFNHAGIYVGNGVFAHASSTGKPGTSRTGSRYVYKTDNLEGYLKSHPKFKFQVRRIK